MRSILHALALAVIVTVAALCTLVQLNNVDHAVSQLGRDTDAVVQQVSSPQHHHEAQGSRRSVDR